MKTTTMLTLIATSGLTYAITRHFYEKELTRQIDTLQTERLSACSKSFRSGWDAATEQMTRWMSAEDYRLMTGKPHPYKS